MTGVSETTVRCAPSRLTGNAIQVPIITGRERKLNSLEAAVSFSHTTLEISYLLAYIAKPGWFGSQFLVGCVRRADLIFTSGSRRTSYIDTVMSVLPQQLCMYLSTPRIMIDLEEVE